MNCSAQACMDVCDFACGFDECPGETGMVDDDAHYFAREKGMNALKAVHITTAFLSVLGSLFVLVTYHLIPTHKGASLRIVYAKPHGIPNPNPIPNPIPNPDQVLAERL